jgi:hypothetical protein
VHVLIGAELVGTEDSNPGEFPMIPHRILSIACGTVLLLAAPADAGRVPCPGSVRATCQPKDVNVYPITFRGGTPAVISLQGDGRTDLALVVLDGAGRVVGQSVGKSPSLSWPPPPHRSTR